MGASENVSTWDTKVFIRNCLEPSHKEENSRPVANFAAAALIVEETQAAISLPVFIARGNKREVYGKEVPRGKPHAWGITIRTRARLAKKKE